MFTRRTQHSCRSAYMDVRASQCVEIADMVAGNWGFHWLDAHPVSLHAIHESSVTLKPGFLASHKTSSVRPRSMRRTARSLASGTVIYLLMSVVMWSISECHERPTPGTAMSYPHTVYCVYDSVLYRNRNFSKDRIRERRCHPVKSSYLLFES